MAEDTVTKVQVVPATTQEQPTAEEKRIGQAQADQMYGNADAHAPAVPKRLDFSGQGPAAQGPNLTKEESEFAAASADNKAAEEIPEEKTPAPVQASTDPVAVAGKAPRFDKNGTQK